MAGEEFSSRLPRLAGNIADVFSKYNLIQRRRDEVRYGQMASARIAAFRPDVFRCAPAWVPCRGFATAI